MPALIAALWWQETGSHGETAPIVNLRWESDWISVVCEGSWGSICEPRISPYGLCIMVCSQRWQRLRGPSNAYMCQIMGLLFFWHVIIWYDMETITLHWIKQDETFDLPVSLLSPSHSPSHTRRSWQASSGDATASVAAASTGQLSRRQPMTTRCCGASCVASAPTCCACGAARSSQTQRNCGSSGGGSSRTWPTSSTTSWKVSSNKQTPCSLSCCCLQKPAVSNTWSTVKMDSPN